MKLFFALFIFVFSALFGQDFDNEDPQTSHTETYHHEHPDLDAWREHLSHEGQSFESKFFHMLFILGLLIAFMILASWALKRMMKSRMTQINTSNSIKVLETRYLSPRATLYLIEVENETFLIAESPQTVTLLTKRQ